jgi:hypothetical protein
MTEQMIMVFDLTIFLRLFLLTNAIKHTSILNTYKGRIACLLSNIEPNDKLIMRAWLFYNPLQLIMLMLIFSVFICSYGMYLAERPKAYEMFILG